VTRARIAGLVLLAALAGGRERALNAAESAGAAQAAGLKIVVIAGEDGVNIIQQKTAVAPVVEVRDRNDQPVAGAVVQFAIRGGRATFNGARTVTVTTNAAGRAAVIGLTPTASGAVQISATAAFQGQTAAVTIAQTNVLTAAQAAQAAQAATASAGGGGMSGTTIGLVGAAIGGGALAATSLGGDEPSGTASAGGSTKATYTGTYAGQFDTVDRCISTMALTGGTVVIQLVTAADGTVSGTAEVNHTATQIAFSCPGWVLNPPYSFSTGRLPVTGTPASLSFSYDRSGTFTTPNGVIGTHTWAQRFLGSFEGAVLSGVLTHTETNQNTNPPGPFGQGAISFPITLR